MTADSLTRYLQRLPTLITFFFSVMLVTVFRELSVTFGWTTAPSFDPSDPRHLLIALSFSATLFFVVSVWLSYSLLIERYPYTLDYTLFFFDVVRFSVLFMIFNFAFLAGQPPHYLAYVAMLSAFHLLMAFWHGYRQRHVGAAEAGERRADRGGHLVRSATYALLALAYYLAVTLRWPASEPFALHAGLVVVTSALVVYWNARRLVEMKAKALQAQGAAASAPPAPAHAVPE
jgi:hypothetical protein